jgi:predicted transposase/invertase (TIGR01784 family)
LKTDSVFYRIFKSNPGILFELLGQSPELAQGYSFESVEIKQVAFRLDGVLLPALDAPDQTVWFIETQMQDDTEFYHRFFAQIHLYLKLHPKTYDWQSIVIFPSRNIEPKNLRLHRTLINSDQVHRVYLEDFSDTPTESLGIGMMQLIVSDTVDAIAKAKALLVKTQPLSKTDAKLSAVVELIETIIVYKFPSLGREEIERMLGLSELRETKVYQEALQEGEQRGALREQSLILRLLSRRVGTLAPGVEAQVKALDLPRLEALGEALLDFTGVDDLVGWLRGNEST